MAIYGHIFNYLFVVVSLPLTIININPVIPNHKAFNIIFHSGLSKFYNSLQFTYQIVKVLAASSTAPQRRVTEHGRRHLVRVITASRGVVAGSRGVLTRAVTAAAVESRV